MIDLTHLATLTSVYRTGSVVAAADDLGYTPSAVSQQIKRLERSVGGQVLERVGRGVALTELGRHLVDEGARLLAAMEELQAGLGVVRDGSIEGSVRLAAFSTGVRGIIAPALEQMRTTAPGIDVAIEELDPADAVDAVAHGRADLCLAHSWGTRPLTVPRHCASEVIATDRADVLLHRNHPLATAEVIGAAQLADEPWVTAPPGSVCHEWIVQMLGLHGLSPIVRHWAMEFSSQISLVSHGLCVGLVPRLGREPLPAEVIAVPVADPVPTRRVALVWRRSMAPSPAITTVRASLAAQARQHRGLGLGPQA